MMMLLVGACLSTVTSASQSRAATTSAVLHASALRPPDSARGYGVGTCIMIRVADTIIMIIMIMTGVGPQAFKLTAPREHGHKVQASRGCEGKLSTDRRCGRRFSWQDFLCTGLRMNSGKNNLLHGRRYARPCKRKQASCGSLALLSYADSHATMLVFIIVIMLVRMSSWHLARGVTRHATSRVDTSTVTAVEGGRKKPGKFCRLKLCRSF